MIHTFTSPGHNRESYIYCMKIMQAVDGWTDRQIDRQMDMDVP